MSLIYILRWDVENWVEDDEGGSLRKGEMSCDFKTLEEALLVVARLRGENSDLPDTENCRIELFEAREISTEREERPR